MEVDQAQLDERETLAWCNKIRGRRGWEPLEAMPPNLPLRETRSRTCPVASAIGGRVGVVSYSCVVPAVHGELPLPVVRFIQRADDAIA